MSNYKNVPKDELPDLLAANAVKREDFDYFHSLTDEELARHKQEYFDAMSDIDREQEVLDAAKEKFKLDTAGPKVLAQNSYRVVKAKGIQVKEEVFLIPDFDNQVMEYINSEGEIVFSRKLYANERQYKIRAVNE